MKRRLLSWLVCPTCGKGLEASPVSQAIAEGTLACPDGHRFAISAGVPRLLREERLEPGDAAHSIRESFSREWEHFDYERDRTWGVPADERMEEFLRHVDLRPEELRGKRVLDAGCGNGTLSHALTSLGCEVVAADISRQVGAAHRWFDADDDERLHFLQADLMNLPLQPGSFDVVFCAGVLHHTPNTRDSFEKVIPALAPGGTVFVWLYHHVPGRLLAFKSLLRRVISPQPAPVKRAIVVSLLPQAMVRQYARTLLGRNHPRERLGWRERLVILLDSYTPRYRWEHTPDELAGWYRELGFVDIKTTELGEWGFGVAARRPSVARQQRSAA